MDEDEASVDREQVEDDNVLVLSVSSIGSELIPEVPVRRRRGPRVPDPDHAVGQDRRRRRRRNADMLENNQVIRQRLRPRP